MSITTNDIDAARAGAAAVIRTLPAANLTPGEAVDGASAVASAVAVPGSKAVSAALAGNASGTIVVILSPEIAATVENGPVGPQELVAGLTPALDDAVAALAATLGDVRHEAGQSLDAEVAISGAESYDTVTVVPFLSEGAPVGSLVLLLNHPANSNAAEFETLSTVLTGTSPLRGVELLGDVEMGVTAELGRTRMTVRELLGLQPGSIVELDRAAGSPVDLLVNGTLVARGEVVVVDEEFGVRITEIIGYDPKPN